MLTLTRRLFLALIGATLARPAICEPVRAPPAELEPLPVGRSAGVGGGS